MFHVKHMTDRTPVGERRMALALRTMDAMDYEATGQVTRPRRRAVHVLATTGKGCLKVSKGVWNVTRWLCTSREREIHVRVIDRSNSVGEAISCILCALLVLGVLVIIGAA